jgi:alpha-galactosidase
MRSINWLAHSSVVVGVCGLDSTSGAQTRTDDNAITFNARNGVFQLRGGHVSYVMGVSTSGELQSIYWGPEVGPSDEFARPKPVGRPFEIADTPQEFAGSGGGLLTEPSLKVNFPDGNRDLGAALFHQWR